MCYRTFSVLFAFILLTPVVVNAAQKRPTTVVDVGAGMERKTVSSSATPGSYRDVFTNDTSAQWTSTWDPNGLLWVDMTLQNNVLNWEYSLVDAPAGATIADVLADGVMGVTVPRGSLSVTMGPTNAGNTIDKKAEGEMSTVAGLLTIPPAPAIRLVRDKNTLVMRVTTSNELPQNIGERTVSTGLPYGNYTVRLRLTTTTSTLWTEPTVAKYDIVRNSVVDVIRTFRLSPTLPKIKVSPSIVECGKVYESKYKECGTVTITDEKGDKLPSNVHITVSSLPPAELYLMGRTESGYADIGVTPSDAPVTTDNTINVVADPTRGDRTPGPRSQGVQITAQIQ